MDSIVGAALCGRPRGQQVMIDRDLAELYEVETKVLNQAVKRNHKRFPPKFLFQLTKIEFNSLKSQFVTSNDMNGRGGRRKLPYVFTEQGVSMLSAVLKSDIAIEISIKIMDAFVEMRKLITTNSILLTRVSNIEQKVTAYDVKLIEADNKFEQIFKALEDKSIKPKQGVFYDEQIFDAYVFVADLIKSAKKSIVLIDNYVDESVLQLFTKRKKTVSVTIYTKNFSTILKQDLEKYNAQYPKIEMVKFTKSHDRFLIMDETTVYHFGASLKDLGKRWFAFSKMDIEAMEMIVKVRSDSLSTRLRNR